MYICFLPLYLELLSRLTLGITFIFLFFKFKLCHNHMLSLKEKGVWNIILRKGAKYFLVVVVDLVVSVTTCVGWMVAVSTLTSDTVLLHPSNSSDSSSCTVASCRLSDGPVSCRPHLSAVGSPDKHAASGVGQGDKQQLKQLKYDGAIVTSWEQLLQLTSPAYNLDPCNL